MKKVCRLLALVLVILMLGGCAAQTPASGGSGETAPTDTAEPEAPGENNGEGAGKRREDLVVGVSWRSAQEARWVTELEVIRQVCEEMGITMISQVSENDAQRQAGQIENLVAQDIDILIVCCNEKGAIDNALRAAHEEGVFVCYYEQVDGEVYFDMSGGNEQFEIGQAITRTIGEMGITGNVAYLLGDSTGGTGVMSFRDGMVDSMKDCDITVVGEQWVTNWDPATGMAHAENWIAEYGDSLSAILCMNDGLAGGAVQALENAGLAGQVLTCGQDCDLQAVQRIAAGTQVSTVLKSGVEYPRLFTEAAVALYLGEISEADFDHTDYNSLGETKPFLMYPGIVVTQDNIQETVIDAGVYTYEEIYGE